MPASDFDGPRNVGRDRVERVAQALCLAQGRVQFAQAFLKISLFADSIRLQLAGLLGLGELFGFGLAALVEQFLVPLAQGGQFLLNPLQFAASLFHLGHARRSFDGRLGHQMELLSASRIRSFTLARATVLAVGA